MIEGASAAGPHISQGLAAVAYEAAVQPASAGAAASPPPPSFPHEIRAWYFIDVATSVYSTVGISGFLPLLIQSAALEASGFPSGCPNVLTDAGAIAAVWPSSLPAPPVAYLSAGAPDSAACDGSVLCVGGVCKGFPPLPADCRDILGMSAVGLRASAFGMSVDPTAFATLCITLSVVAQAVAFLCLAGAADYGSARKRWLLSASYVGAGACVACAFIGPSTWWIGMPGAIVSNLAFGIATILYNAFLPLLVSSLPEVAALNHGTPMRAELEAARSSELSSRGFAFGYVAGVVGILLCVPLAVVLPELTAYAGAMVVCGVWWLVFIQPVRRNLLPRPGPPLPEGVSVLTQSFRSARETVSALRSLPVALTYLIAWAFFSDGVYVFGVVGGLYASSRVRWSCTLPKSAGILLLFVIVPLAAAVGNEAYLRISRALHMSPRAMLITTLVAVGTVVPIWGAVGIETGVEILLLGAWYGFNLGAMQAFSRTLFSSLIPPGREAQLFAFYELTNRGSSWLGPMILTIVQAQTGSMTWGFLYVAVAVLGGAFAVSRLDLVAGAAQARACAVACAVSGARSTPAPSMASTLAGVAVDDAPLTAPRGGATAASDW